MHTRRDAPTHGAVDAATVVALVLGLSFVVGAGWMLATLGPERAERAFETADRASPLEDPPAPERTIEASIEDAPEEVFEEPEFNEVIGLGGGAGGSFGARFGGRRNLRAAGGRARLANSEEYAGLPPNAYQLAALDPKKTFSLDVDTASYANARRFLRDGRLPPIASVRVEEFVNAFRYDGDPFPVGDEPFSMHVEVAGCPWNGDHRLARIAVRTPDLRALLRQPARLTFLVDVSGSMSGPDKLPLLKSSLELLVRNLASQDRVAIVTYASEAGVALPSTSCYDQATILAAIQDLAAGGGTNGSGGIQAAYAEARRGFLPGGVNRVLLATDGDFNVGVTDREELDALIRGEAADGVFLSVLGFGKGNLKDATMELLADHGNGNYSYIDSLAEANRVLVEELGATLVTVAKDVKVQVEFNPAQVAAFRLIGYENRLLEHEEFADDTVDAGEIGAGRSVTALFEVVPHGAPLDLPGVDGDALLSDAIASSADDVGDYPGAAGELCTLRVRYKDPEGDTSRLLERPVVDSGFHDLQTSDDFRFAAAVATFAMLLRESEHRGWATWGLVERLTERSLGPDLGGQRREFLELVRLARALADARPVETARSR